MMCLLYRRTRLITERNNVKDALVRGKELARYAPVHVRCIEQRGAQLKIINYRCTKTTCKRFKGR